MASKYKPKICSHEMKPKDYHCHTCDIRVCADCSSYDHPGHRFSVFFPESFCKRFNELKNCLARMKQRTKKLTTYLKSVKKNQEDYSREIQSLTNQVNTNREQWKKQIDEIADLVLAQIYTIAGKDYEELNKREADLSENLTELSKFPSDRVLGGDYRDILMTAEDCKEKEMRQKFCPLPILISPPCLVSGRIDVDHLRKAFGQVVRVDKKTPSDSETPVHQCVRPRIDTSIVATISPPISCDYVSTVGEDNAWVGYRYVNTKIALVNKGGQVLQKVDLGFKPGCVTTTNTGEVLVTDFYHHQVKKYMYTKDGQYVNTIINTYPNRPRGLCTTSDNDILVCLESLECLMDNKVIRVTTTGQIKQTIKHDKENETLFVDPRLVQENINKDVCVLDYHEAIVVVNKDGEFRFRYPNTYTYRIGNVRRFDSIACDRLGNILLSDRLDYRHRIHLIDINGKCVQCVLDQRHGMKSPCALSVNKIGELWVCNNYGKELKVIKYNS